MCDSDTMDSGQEVMQRRGSDVADAEEVVQRAGSGIADVGSGDRKRRDDREPITIEGVKEVRSVSVTKNVATDSSIQINGHIDGALYLNYHFPSGTIFGGLKNQESQSFVVNDGVWIQRLEARRRLQEGRTKKLLQQPDTYRSPYAVVKNNRVRRILLEIAERFQFLDRGFAEYFQEIVPSFNHDHVRRLLEDARKSIAMRQSHDAIEGEASVSIVLGQLGDFCEDVAQGWMKKNGQKLKFAPHNRDKDILYYLQDAYEVPYWDLMMNLFSNWRVNSKSLSGDVVIHVLNSVKLDIKEKKTRLGDEMRPLPQSEKEQIAPIIRGIDTRLETLGSLWDNNASNFEIDDMLSCMFEAKTIPPDTSSSEKPAFDPVTRSQSENVWLVALSLVCVMIATIPLMRGFAISAQEGNVGTTQDADFYYLIQGNVMTVLGNFLMVIPLLKESWFSPAYIWMWTFMLTSLVMCGVSVGLYLLVHTGWSSMIAFFASVAGTSAVLVLTQATAWTAPGEKIKKE